MNELNSILNFIQNNAMASTAFVSAAIEMGLRLTPSQKPLSIMYGVDAAFKTIGNIFSAAGAFLDKVLPQNLSK